ncbi:MAG: hypothetical protein ABIH39_06155 [Candidatus Margulisiibacteriota bacterium]
MKKNVNKLWVLLLIIGLISAAACAGQSDSPAISISGAAYLHYITDQNGNAEFTASRICLDLKRQLGDNVFRYTTDIDGSIGDYSVTDVSGNSLASSNKDYWTVYTKYLYVELTKLLPGTSILFGQFGTPWIGWVDKIHGFRYISKSMTDYFSVLSSADRGIGIKTKISDLNIEACLINGEGYKDADGADNRMDIAIRADWASRGKDGLIIGAHTQMSGTETTGASCLESNKSVYNLLLGYMEGSDWTAACEIAGGKKDGKSIQGISVFGNAALTDAVRAFGRYDQYDADTGTDNNDKKLIIAGIESCLAEKVKTSINMKQTQTGSADALTTYYLDMEVGI